MTVRYVFLYYVIQFKHLVDTDFVINVFTGG